MKKLDKKFESAEASRKFRGYAPLWTFYEMLRKIGVSKVDDDDIDYLCQKLNIKKDKANMFLEEYKEKIQENRYHHSKPSFSKGVDRKNFLRNINKED